MVLRQYSQTHKEKHIQNNKQTHTNMNSSFWSIPPTQTYTQTHEEQTKTHIQNEQTNTYTQELKFLVNPAELEAEEAQKKLRKSRTDKEEDESHVSNAGTAAPARADASTAFDTSSHFDQTNFDQNHLEQSNLDDGQEDESVVADTPMKRQRRQAKAKAQGPPYWTRCSRELCACVCVRARV